VAQEIAVVDASPLIALANVDGLGWLRKLYGKHLPHLSVEARACWERVEPDLRKA